MTNASDSNQRSAKSSLQSPGVPHRQSLRWVPFVLLILAMGLLRALPMLFQEREMMSFMASMMGPAAIAVLILLWWVTFSRAPWQEKVVGFLGTIAVSAIGLSLLHPSLAGFGGMIFAIPTAGAVLGVALSLATNWSSVPRTVFALTSTFVCFLSWTLVQSEGVDGSFKTKLIWRWQPTSEQKYLASLSEKQPVAPPSASDTGQSVRKFDYQNLSWAGFRGPKRDGVQPGIVVSEDWQSQPPREVWRRRIGPAWSSFAVADDRLYTQEQRGDSEAVVCLDAKTGQEVWVYQYEARFWEPVAGAGPRATPTLTSEGLFALGADGALVRLNPLTGELIWKASLQEDAGRKPPMWGFSASPLVHDGRVVVHAGGKDGKGVLAYDIDGGKLAWSAPSGDHSYSSPQLVSIDSAVGILMVCNEGLECIAPDTGEVMWRHDWTFNNYRALQPLVDGRSILITTGMGTGARKLDVQRNGAEWSIQESWTSRGMKPDFNDSVQHQGYVYGFDDVIFCCIEAATGKRMWKKGRYGNGQIVLLPDGNQILVLSEEGELVLLRTNPEKLEELARCKVLSGKTWNHPVIVGNQVYVRNAEEAACFELPLASSATASGPSL